MSETLKTVSPGDGAVYAERPVAGPAEIDQALAAAKQAEAAWAATPVAERVAILSRAVDLFVAEKAAIGEEITRQMGRPISQSPGEVAGFEERARHMLDIAAESLADIDVGAKDGFTRFIRRAPLGTVAVIAPWNFPYLTSVNAVWPALTAGNCVILKHSHQTPICAERYQQVLDEAGLPAGVFQHLHLSRSGADTLMRDARVDFVAFTGSVDGGHAVMQALSERFVGCGLELGGKDPAYVRADADLDHAAETLVDGACFNSGQSCCGIERIYVASSVFDAFVEKAVAIMQGYKLGDPMAAETNLGPMVRPSAADFVRGQVAEAVAAGAKAHIDETQFDAAKPGTAYCAPQLLTGVDHRMRIMTEESFGPVVGVMAVADDDEAVRLMNDSDYGLTASVFTKDEDAALAIGDRLETGTVFMNRCDYLDPALAWTGVKNSGRGCTLSSVGLESMTRPKSFHLKTQL